MKSFTVGGALIFKASFEREVSDFVGIVAGVLRKRRGFRSMNLVSSEVGIGSGSVLVLN